jgi:biopolymer transport protein ExbB
LPLLQGRHSHGSYFLVLPAESGDHLRAPGGAATQKIIPFDFLGEIQEYGKQGNVPKILSLCRRKETPLTRILDAGFRRLEFGYSEMERALEAAGQHEVSLLTSHLRLLGAIGAIAPMLGLLGTVTGMIKAFENIAQSGAGNPNLVASGIAETLTTTAAGLIVAIPSLAAYHFFRGRNDRMVFEIEEVATALLAAISWKRSELPSEEMERENSQA